MIERKDEYICKNMEELDELMQKAPVDKIPDILVSNDFDKDPTMFFPVEAHDQYSYLIYPYRYNIFRHATIEAWKENIEGYRIVCKSRICFESQGHFERNLQDTESVLLLREKTGECIRSIK